MFGIIGSEFEVSLILMVLAMSAFKESKYHVSKEELERERLVIEKAKLDPANFEWLYKRYKEEIFRFIYQRLDDKDLSFDITSQVFLKAMLNIQKYQDKGVPFSSWLYRIAINELNIAFKKNSSLRTIKLDTVQIEDLIETAGEKNIELHKGLVGALCILSAEELYLVEMRFFEQRSFKEMGEILNITENNAKVKLYRVLDKMKKIMTGRNEKI